VARGFLSAARLDDARRAAAVAEAQQDGARAQRAVAEQGTDVVQALAQLALARSASAAAQARLAQATLQRAGRRPGAGAPGGARPDRAAGARLLALALAGPLQLVAQVDERYLEQLQVGQMPPACSPTPSRASASRRGAVDFAAGRCPARGDRGQVALPQAAAGLPARGHDAVGRGRDRAPGARRWCCPPTRCAAIRPPARRRRPGRP
jgi:hypothetical protein